jgi:hypothetical protein
MIEARSAKPLAQPIVAVDRPLPPLPALIPIATALCKFLERRIQRLDAAVEWGGVESLDGRI